MPSPLPRRPVLRWAAVALAGGGGCTGPVGTTDRSDAPPPTAPPTSTPPDARTYADVPAGPEQYPERPADPTPDAVRSYARSFEHAAAYNTLYEADAETVSVDCEAVHDGAADGGHYALATCTGFASYADGVHADWGQVPALYYVAGDLTVRVERLRDRHRSFEDVFAAENPAANVEQPGEGRSAGFRVYNLDTESHAVSVSVSFRGGPSPRPVFASEYHIDPAAGVLQGSVTYRRGEYRIEARVAGGGRTTARWTVEAGPGYGEQWTSVVVAPTGRVSVRRPAFGEL